MRRDEFTFGFLNDSAAPFVEDFRNLADSWFADYPPPLKPDLRGRFRSKAEHNHQSAFMELYLYHLLSRAGYEVVVHPERPDTGNTPDFLAMRDSRIAFYVEARHVGLSDSGNSKRVNQLLSGIDKIGVHDFFVGAQVRGELNELPKVSSLNRQIATWLTEQKARLESGQILKPFRWRSGEFQLNLTAIPKTERGKTRKTRLIGSQSFAARWLNTTGEIRDALVEKSKRYGSLDGPLVLAIQTFSWHCDESDVIDALFGREGVTVEWDQGQSTPNQIPFRHADGFWLGEKGPRNRQVAAVLILSGLNPWNMHVCEPVLYHNPTAEFPLALDAWPLKQICVSAHGELVRRPGVQDVKEILGLPPIWPGEQNFDL